MDWERGHAYRLLLNCWASHHAVVARRGGEDVHPPYWQCLGSAGRRWSRTFPSNGISPPPPSVYVGTARNVRSKE